MTHLRLGLLTILACAVLSGCTPNQDRLTAPPESDAKAAPSSAAVAEPPPVVLQAAVAFWKDGKAQGQVDAARADEEGNLLLDLGEEWTPYILTEAAGPDGQLKTSEYRSTYLALARGEFPEDRHGYRAQKDQYLELYGILPTLALLRQRFRDVRGLQCAQELDLVPLQEFDGFLAYQRGRRPARRLARYELLKPQMAALVTRAQVESLDQVTRVHAIDDEEWKKVEEYRTLAPEIEAIAAAQARLECEGFFTGRGQHTAGLFDWRTHEALAEFERRHRVYGWGFIGDATLAVLQKSPQETEQEAVIRALTERAVHAAEVIEDGSTSTLRDDEPRTYKAEDGTERQIRNLEAELRERVIAAFGLQNAESTYAWLESLGEISAEKVVAVQNLELPPYYADVMELSVSTDRGDVWYEFPYDEEGKARSQPVSRRPRLSIFVNYNDQKIPLARFGTTVGGWRGEFIDGAVMWKYKGSPVGKRVWSRISAAPIWVPPESTPPRVMLTKRRKRGEDFFEVDYHTTGPSYASAYGLVAAYHRKYYRSPDGKIQVGGDEGMIQVGGDEGIRTHGSVDYMSIMRRHSHGCHRMHNHIAVRLMSFVLEHRPHTRYGQQPMVYRREFEFEEETYLMEFDKGGYNFVLEEPLFVETLPGRVRGQVKEPIEVALPRFDREVGAYVMP
ncbi:MAG: L,D-transpeptidase, partial [Deltaproteobacteria bacterium]|nr:L,D-transpeptidase [Deltaproteobacteria bacterium]